MFMENVGEKKRKSRGLRKRKTSNTRGFEAGDAIWLGNEGRVKDRFRKRGAASSEELIKDPSLKKKKKRKGGEEKEGRVDRS